MTCHHVPNTNRAATGAARRARRELAASDAAHAAGAEHRLGGKCEPET
jgi:hypothetical protein